MKLSKSEENYIKSIYNLQLKTNRVNTNTLATHLNTRAASITDMLKKLQRKKLLDYKKYYGFKLNSTGNRQALKIIRRHRLWELFLTSKLGMDWDKVHDIAEELEHVSSRELIDLLDKYLDHPSTDPHGDPIPDIYGVMPVLQQVSLKKLQLKRKAIISSISDQTPKMMAMMKHYGIMIGASLKVIKAFDFDGSLQIKITRKPECIISDLAAQNIFVYDN